MNKTDAKHSSKQVRRKSGVPNLNAEFAADTGAGADAKASKGATQKAKH
ncbi:hypothetical protein RE628_14115 [Paenibacillus sp. D2_2]|nr:hypothetical protein [Paenibacillus sp. D2_2]WMT43279.1 hypothetical protein RE628_14115 [Paenibacillus sp. D2_2]